MPRPLTPHERAVLLRLVESEGSPAELIEQLSVAQFGEPWFEASQSFSLVVPSDAPRFLGGRHTGGGFAIVGGAGVYEGGVVEDDNYVGEMMMWTQHGLLADMEYSWTTDEMPSSLPPIEDIVCN